MKNETLLKDFKQHVLAAGKSKNSVENYTCGVNRFLTHVGEQRIDRLSEDTTRSFFASLKEHTRQSYAMVISQFLNFSVSRLPVPVNARGEKSPRASAPTKKELALKQRWTVDKLIDQKSTDDELIAKLARKVIDHYVFFQRLLKDDDIDLDTVSRFADECRELIESNLMLFMSLSSQGHNVHSKIDERVQR